MSYRQSFLEQYIPKVTFYLSESLRAQLHTLGRSPIEEAPAGTFARDILNRLLIDLSWSLSRLEGNTYSLLDTEHVGVTIETVIALHAFLSDGLMPAPGACGRLRNRPVEIGGSVYLSLAMPQRIGNCFR